MKHLGRYIFRKFLMPGSSPSTADINWSAVGYGGSQVTPSNQAERLRTSVPEFFLLLSVAMWCFSKLGDHHLRLITHLHCILNQRFSKLIEEPESPGGFAGSHPRESDSISRGEA